MSAQALNALSRANQVRTYRAHLKASLRCGKRKLSTVLRADDDLLATMRLAELLEAVPGLGKVKVRRILHMHRMAPSQIVATLNPSRREQLLIWLSTNHKGLRV